MKEKGKYTFIFIVFIFASLLSVRGFGTELTEIALGYGGMEAFFNETQWMNQSGNNMTMFLWIPQQFWRITAAVSDPKPTEEQVQQFEKILSPYVIFAVSQGEIGPFGGMEWTSEDRLRSSLVLIDQVGGEYRPFKDNTVNQDAKNLVTILKPIMANLTGPLGENFHFYFFPSLTNEKKLIADPLKDGFFFLKLGDETHKWRLPLGSMIPQKKCPIDGEEFSGTWKYCPYHGKELVAPVSQ